MADLIAVSPSQIAAEWEEFEPKLSMLASISYGRLMVGDIVEAITKGAMQLWSLTDGDENSVMLTEVLRHPRQREVHIISATGYDAKSWQSAWPEFEKWVRSEGCATITASCREGWKRVLAPLDFVERSVVLEKRL